MGSLDYTAPFTSMHGYKKAHTHTDVTFQES